ncbi:MAG: aldose 1-epimerase family protein [Clostridia bacterium]|nr:aldose 1-epimerase family protein [Clostridia bacterium]
MQKSISNGIIGICADSFGSTLTSVRSEKSGYEFLWQPDPDIWNGQSPILFPVIGGLLNGECEIDGKSYKIIRHGIARHREFELVGADGNSLEFVQTESEGTLESFPFSYELRVKFLINGNSLTVTHTVKNTDRRPMPFGIGAHPAFKCERGDSIVFEKNEHAYCERIGGDSLLNGERDLILDGENTIKITEHLFDKDVMIFEGLESRYVTLKKERLKKSVKFFFGGCEYFSVWAKPDAPFVCLEPWCGINDSHEKNESFYTKRGNITLLPDQSFSFEWRAEFNEDV